MLDYVYKGFFDVARQLTKIKAIDRPPLKGPGRFIRRGLGICKSLPAMTLSLIFGFVTTIDVSGVTKLYLRESVKIVSSIWARCCK